MQISYVIVTQGVDVLHTTDKDMATKLVIKGNEDYQRYIDECSKTNETPVDNELFLYEEKTYDNGKVEAVRLYV